MLRSKCLQPYGRRGCGYVSRKCSLSASSRYFPALQSWLDSRCLLKLCIQSALAIGLGEALDVSLSPRHGCVDEKRQVARGLERERELYVVALSDGGASMGI